MTPLHSLFGRQSFLAFARVPKARQAAVRLKSIDHRRGSTPLDSKQITGELAVALVTRAADLLGLMIALALPGDLDIALITAPIGILT